MSDLDPRFRHFSWDSLRSEPWTEADIIRARDMLTAGRAPANLTDVVNVQLVELGIDPLADGPQELPAPPPERTDTYAHAFGTAARKCDHSRLSHSTRLGSSERQCDDCGRYFNAYGY